jgi:hypothetical protein
MVWMIAIVGCDRLEQDKSKTESADSADQSILKSTEKGGVRLDVEVYPKEPRLSDLVDLTIKIVHPSAMKVEPPVFGQSVGDFAVRDFSERSSTTASTTINTTANAESGKPTDSEGAPSDEKTTQVIRYQLEPMFSGKHLIRSIPIVFTEKSAQGEETRDVVQSEPIEINVVSEFGDVSSDLSQVDPMTDPIAPKQNWFWLVLGIVCLIGFLSAWVYWLIKRRSELPVVAPMLSPEQIANMALAELVAEQLPTRGMVKEFYLRLTGIVRVFIESKTGLRAPEQTTEEFLRDMRASSQFDGPQAYRLQEFLTAADLVKYAGQTPDESSITQSLERAREFIAIRFEHPEEATPASSATEGNRG